MNLKQRIRNYFGFSKTETNALLFLIPLTTLIVVGYSLTKDYLFFEHNNNPSDISKLDSLAKSIRKKDLPTAENKNSASKIAETPNTKIYKSLDPNNISAQKLEDHGLSRNTANNWVKYLAKGGRFNKPEDLRKIYGMTEKQLLAISPYLDFDDAVTSKTKIQTLDSLSQTSSKSDHEEYITHSFDLNLADTTDFKKIKGVGKVLSSRIINFRNSLGGFLYESQLYEVYHLDSAVAENIMVAGFITASFNPQKININQADKKLLSKHPYISFKLAELIVAYRKQHDGFRDISEIKNIPIVTEEMFQKLENYITLH